MHEIVNKRTSILIAEQIADQILSGKIEGNTPLRQEELAEALGASRIPVREALQTLESQGLAVRLATRHIVSAKLEEETIREIYATICGIEEKAMESIWAGGGKDIFQEGLRTCSSFEAFHMLICRCTENQYLKVLLEHANLFYLAHALRAWELEASDERAQEAEKMERIQAVQIIRAAEQEEKKACIQWNRCHFEQLAECVIRERRNV
ncbi:MAG: GntR family transcriptional regulator [Lachnospiraceae bacterium]|nr:GntR family transcriptional regulator [Lachnospiraceae bacterium]